MFLLCFFESCVGVRAFVIGLSQVSPFLSLDIITWIILKIRYVDKPEYVEIDLHCFKCEDQRFAEYICHMSQDQTSD